jgi:hypothetical protein
VKFKEDIQMNELLNGLIKLEKEHGMLGTIIGILILVIVTIAAIGIICATTVAWLKITNFILQYFFGYTL